MPRAAGVPFLGVLPQVWRDTLGFFLKAGTENPGIVQLNMGPARFHLISHPDSVKYVLQDNQRNYGKGYDRAKPLLGEGLVTSEGELWRRQRRLMQPAFHKNHLASLLPTMTGATEEMLEQWRARSSDEPLDIAREMMLLTQTIILRTMFSTDIGERAEEIADSFAQALEYLNIAIVAPFPQLQTLPTPATRRFQRAMAVIDNAIYGIINERRASGVKRNDLLQMLIDARDEETGEGMSDRQMHDEVLTIFLAGHETTASLLGWSFYLLGRSPDVMLQLRKEFHDVLEKRAPAIDDLARLQYTGQVLHEALRLYPPAWMFARTPIEDDEIAGVRVKAGSMIMLSPYVTHRLPQVWERPGVFDPDRFAQGRETDRPRYAFFPFGGGPRMCIGNNFALMEAPALLSMILQAFTIEPVPGYALKAQPAATLRPRPGIFVRIRPVP
jgi:cytochrome P450